MLALHAAALPARCISQAAVEAGKHVFAEKPVAVDAPGVHSVLESCKLAKTKNLSVVSGLCLRYDNGFRETVQRLHDGAVGEILTLLANDYRSGRWAKPKQPGWTEMHYQMRNWYNFTWLSGDFNVEQHVHFLDVCAWVMKDAVPGQGHRHGRPAGAAPAPSMATSTIISRWSTSTPTGPGCSATAASSRAARTT